MRAVRLHGVGDLRVEDIAPPGPPGPGDVRIAVEAAGICGSDLHNFRTGRWISRAPSVPGHELAGVVTGIGARVEGFSLGDRVVADSRVWCGACPPCLAGRRQLCERLGFVGEVCDGGFAEAVTLPARLLVKVPPGLDPVIAALAEPFSVALHAVRRLRRGAGEPVLVVGCGPIGGLAALILSRQGGPVLVADRNAARAALVAEVTGAAAVGLDREAIRAATAGAALRHAVEATGSAAALGTLIDMLDGAATVALVGIFGSRLDLDPNLLVERELSLVGCHAFADELPEAVAALADEADTVRRLIESEIPLGEVPDAYRRLIAGEASGLKTIVRIASGRPA